MNVLGLLWDTVSDTLPKEPTYVQHSLTMKRDVLKNVSKLLILLGLLCQPKWFYRSYIQQHKLDRDELYLMTLKPNGLISLLISNQFISLSLTGITSIQMVSPDGYTYSWTPARKVTVQSSIFVVMSKTHVAPLKELTLPKLELMATVVGTRLLKCILHSLLPIYTDIPFYMWSDS